MKTLCQPPKNNYFIKAKLSLFGNSRTSIQDKQAMAAMGNYREQGVGLAL